MNRSGIAIFGEVLFDCFPDGERVLGGAPFNVAWHLQAFGRSPRFISRIGRDGEGDAILRSMRQWGMNTESLQRDGQHPTGRVMITLEGGEPSYEIVADVAYDFIAGAELTELQATTLYHGSLGLRNPIARDALSRLKQNHPGRIFMDVNLRDPWWRRESVLDWVADADWVKLNDDELVRLNGERDDLPAAATAFRQRYDLQGLVVTLGERGVLAVAADERAYRIEPEVNLDLVDTVGAGDALSSVIILGLEQGWPLQLTLERAQEFASAIVGRRGAVVDEATFYRGFIEAWELGL
ncbi:MAG: carbohydrate kinase [gamma proteobacterium symbiont of Ctena orbiculata]|uniref:Carbohydrate kinase n=1 Tax=Candidatus Thiodiazotropha taylori TaxID=2792791 RepID=A0A944MDB6_9GAMM|nr:carbohydrate kinase [Candidatus Thiodiazotropha taylori]PUB85152.1 MAG: carbohydrate kinase [gamma proteobacterium symbiont of Ctena orbiculata]MBT3026900.1 carbohydrate kinase [Candidatus Thiodiazotropha taylori]MBT3034534.1 carbohydrate kinase [Candidatus Thiodiazotropha taylori]PVV11829.1 MAG: carbohydrate kinase [gamma proteobacterium symbiont of Ctena orbiculata]